MSIETNAAMLRAITAAVNATGVLGSTAKPDYLGTEVGATSVQLLAGSRIIEPWIGGGGIAQTPFAVWLRASGKDSAQRVNAAAVLMALGDGLAAATLPDVSGTFPESQMSTPTLIERDDTGGEVWRAGYMLESIKRG